MRKEIAKKVADHLRKFPEMFPGPMENDEDLEIFEKPHALSDEEGELLARIMPYPEHIDDMAERVGRDKKTLIPLLDELIKKLWVLREGSKEDGKYFAHTHVFEFYMPWLTEELADFRWKIVASAMAGHADAPPPKPKEIGTADDELLPPFRIVPRESALPEGSEVLSTDRVSFLIDQAEEGELAVAECLCRKEAKIRGQECERGGLLEQCLFFDPFATAAVEAGVARPVTKTEAHELMKRAREHGLVHEAYSSVHPKTICSCCPCCCPVLKWELAKRPGVTTRTNYLSQIDPEKCNGALDCIKICPAEAIQFNENEGVASVDVEKCFGCGMCVEACPSQAASLIAKEKPVVSSLPEDDPARLEIYAHQTGRAQLYKNRK